MSPTSLINTNDILLNMTKEFERLMNSEGVLNILINVDDPLQILMVS